MESVGKRLEKMTWDLEEGFPYLPETWADEPLAIAVNLHKILDNSGARGGQNTAPSGFRWPG